MVIMHVFSALAVKKSQLLEKYIWVTFFNIIPQFIRFFVVFFISLVLALSVNIIIISYAILSLLISLLLFQYIKDFSQVEKFKNIINNNNKVGIKEVISESWPFALGGFFSLIYLQIDLVMLSIFVNDEATGLYNVAVSFLILSYLLPTAIYNYYLWPKLHYLEKNDKIKFLEVYRFGCLMMLLIGLLIMLLMFLVVPFILPFIFNDSYLNAITLFYILGLSIPLRYLATNVGGILLTNDYIKIKVWYQGMVAAINIILNLLLINLYGTKGAAIATVLSELVLVLLYLFSVKKYVFGRDAWMGWHLNMKKINA